MTPRPWRVLFVITSSDIGGAESALHEVATRLDRKRFQPLVCSLLRAGRMATSLVDRGVPVHSMGMAERPRVHQLIAGAIRLRRMLDRLEIDLVQSFLYRANVLASVSTALSSRKPILVTSQRSLEPLTGRLPVWSARWTRRLASRVVAVSEAVREDLVAGGGLDPTRVVVIPNGVDTEYFRRQERSAIARRLGLSEGEPIVGAVGRLAPVKGFDHLLRATRRLLDSGVGIQLLIAGEGPERSSLERLAGELGVSERTHFLGVCDNMRELYSVLDVFALTSLREGSPNALLEAMACSCAVVATRVGGVPEVVEHQLSGVLIPAGDEKQLSEAIGVLVTDASRQRGLGHQARARVESAFSLARTVASYERLYSSLCAAAGGEACGS